MTKDGIDLTDPDAVHVWITAFNERPREKRDAILDMSPPAIPDDEVE